MGELPNLKQHFLSVAGKLYIMVDVIPPQHVLVYFIL